MTTPKGFVGVRTVTIPRATWIYTLILMFAGLVPWFVLGGLGVYFGIVLANRPDVPLQAPDKPSTVTHPKEIKP